MEHAESYWLFLAYPGNPVIRLDARALDRIFACENELVLAVDETTIGLHMLSGATGAQQLVGELAPYTSSAPITSAEMYEEAKRRLAKSGPEMTDPRMWFGDAAIRVTRDLVFVGENAYGMSDIERYAAVDAELPLPTGRLQAGLVMLVVAAHRRGDDLKVLSKRIAEYESSTGR